MRGFRSPPETSPFLLKGIPYPRFVPPPLPQSNCWNYVYAADTISSRATTGKLFLNVYIYSLVSKIYYLYLPYLTCSKSINPCITKCFLLKSIFDYFPLKSTFLMTLNKDRVLVRRKSTKQTETSVLRIQG